MAEVAKQREQHGRGPTKRGQTLGQGRYRLCVSCRRRDVGSKMLALPVQGQRRSYCCLRQTCLLQLQQLSKQRKGGLALPEAALTSSSLQELASGQLLACLGLMRRTGHLALGVQASQSLQQQHEQALVLVTQDGGERAKRALRYQPCPLRAEALGRALGRGPLIAVGCPPGPLAERAAAWLQLWYACGSSSTETPRTIVPVEG